MVFLIVLTGICSHHTEKYPEDLQQELTLVTKHCISTTFQTYTCMDFGSAFNITR